MSKVIYWKEYDEPKKYTHKLGDKTISGEILGEYICEDERVEKFWMVGYTSAKPSDLAKIRGMMVMKNGDRWESEGFEIKLDPDNAQETTDAIISQAENYLTQLMK